MKNDWRDALIEYIRLQARPVDKFSHQPRLYALAVRLAAAAPYDDDILFAAAWLHDLGVFVGHRPEQVEALAKWDHIAYALSTVPPLLERLGFPIDKTPAVLDVIREHMPSGNPTTFEGMLLRDADILEQLGAVGILRTVSKVGRDTRFITFADALHVLRQNADTLPAKLRLPTSQKEAELRIRTLRLFLDAADQESAGAPW